MKTDSKNIFENLKRKHRSTKKHKSYNSILHLVRFYCDVKEIQDVEREIRHVTSQTDRRLKVLDDSTSYRC